MKTLTNLRYPDFLLTGCAERKSDAYQTLQVERDTLAPLAAQLEAEKAELEAQLDALKSGADTSEVPKTLPDRIKLTLNAPSAFLKEIEPLSVDDGAATDALLHWFQEDFEEYGQSGQHRASAENGCAGSQVPENSVLPSFTS